MKADIKVREQEESRFYTLPDGKEVPSVTTILSVIDKSGPLVGWAVRETCNYVESRLVEKWGNLPKGDGLTADDVTAVVDLARKEATRIKTEAADIGTMIHDVIQEWAKETIAGREFFAHFEEERQQKAWEAFLKFVEEYKLKPVFSEMKVVNPVQGYGGTLDLVAAITPPGEDSTTKLALIDIKSSNFFLEIPYGPQVAAYHSAFIMDPLYLIRSGMTIGTLAVLRLDKKTGEPHFHDVTDRIDVNLAIFYTAKALWHALQSAKEAKKKTRGKNK